MRGHVPFLDTNAMEWQVGEAPGLFTKMLSSDPEIGARTALQCIDPARGYKAPTQPHYHSGDEEIFLVKGRFTFDGDNWLQRYSYCFHPARTVHGFRSRVDEESWFLSRIRRRLDYGFSEDYRELVPYNLDEAAPARDISVVTDPARRDWEDIRDEAGTVVEKRLILSRHPDTGEGSMLVEYLPGWVSPHGRHVHSVYEEMFVMEGEILTDDGLVFTAGCYSFRPPEAERGAMSSPKGAVAYVNFGGDLDYRAVGAPVEEQLA